MKTNPTLISLVFALLAPLLFSCHSGSLIEFSTSFPHTADALSASTARHSALEKVIGENDFTPVAHNGDNLPESLRPILGAIGQLNVGCTATHIGQGLVLTAGHCILSSPRSGAQYCRGVGVVWGNFGGNKNLSVSKCKEVLFKENTSAADVALIRVENPPEAFVPVDLGSSSVTSAMTLPRQSITLLSFPRMRPLEWSKSCEMLEYKKTESHNSTTQVDRGFDASTPWFEVTALLESGAPKKFFHSCDTEPGSSGAALIDFSTVKIVGVHGGASDEFNYGTFLDSVIEKISDSPATLYFQQQIGSGN